jgi:polygalacturonase
MIFNYKTLFCTLVLVLFTTQAFATKPVYDVRKFGAVGDGKTNDRQAIQKAIDKCRDTGGTVLLRKGTFLTGQLKLVSNMTLCIDSSATLLGIMSDSETDYPHHMIETVYPNRMKDDCQRRLIYGNHLHNVRVTGGGTINGQGDYTPWMHVKEIGTEKDRPSIFAFVGCRNVEVSNLSLQKPACWTQVYIESDSITLRGLTVNTGRLTPNRDGIDIVDCHNVLIEDCDIQAEDDGICFKSGSEYGCKDVTVRRCKIDKLNVQAGNCFKLGTDGLGSFVNFDVSELTLKNAAQNTGLCIESMDGALIDNLKFSNCNITNCGQAVFVMLADRKRTVPGREKRIGAVSNISFKNITGSGFTHQYPSIITGVKGHNVQNVSFENCNFVLKGGVRETNQTVMEYDGKYPEGSYFGDTGAYAFFLRHADSVSFVNCKISSEQPDARPWMVQDDVKEVVVR